MRFILVLVSTMLFLTCTPVQATEILCQMTSWFDTDNRSGSADFNFTLNFSEANGRISNWYISTECQYGQAWLNGNSIMVSCENNNKLYGNNGTYERLYDINRYSGYVSIIGKFKNGGAVSVYEGNCGAAIRKF